MKISLADQVRAMALERYVQPAKKAGSTEFSIVVRNLQKDLEAGDFPLNYTPLVCNSIKTKSFQRDNHLEIIRIDGPKSQTGTRVVVHYRVVDEGAGGDGMHADKKNQSEAPRDRAQRLTEGLRGLLEKELADRGGAEAFVRWVRSDDENAA
ncbi:MAG: hypothetical protein WA634_01505 [Silvibacterium sp.]